MAHCGARVLQTEDSDSLLRRVDFSARSRRERANGVRTRAQPALSCSLGASPPLLPNLSIASSACFLSPRNRRRRARRLDLLLSPPWSWAFVRHLWAGNLRSWRCLRRFWWARARPARRHGPVCWLCLAASAGCFAGARFRCTCRCSSSLTARWRCCTWRVSRRRRRARFRPSRGRGSRSTPTSARAFGGPRRCRCSRWPLTTSPLRCRALSARTTSSRRTGCCPRAPPRSQRW